MRLDPVARPQFVGQFEILVIAEVAVALQQAEAARVLVEKGRHRRLNRIVERAPDPFARSRMHQEPVRIVQLSAEIVDEAMIVLADEIHRRQRREAEFRDRLAGE